MVHSDDTESGMGYTPDCSQPPLASFSATGTLLTQQPAYQVTAFPSNAVTQAPASLYSIFPDLDTFDPNFPFPSAGWTYDGLATQSATNHLLEGAVSTSPGIAVPRQDSTGFDTHSLLIDSTHTFWSAWQSTSADHAPSQTETSLLSLAAPAQPALSLAMSSDDDTAANDERVERQGGESSQHRPHSRAASPAFFESDRLGQSLSKWNMYYDAARDNGDILRGHRQISLDGGQSTADMTVDALKRRWPALERFTSDPRSKSRIVEAVLFSGISQSEQQAVYQTLARLKDAVYLNFFSLYLYHVHFVIPFLQLPSLDPAVDDGILSLAIISVGAFYSELPNARQFAIIMLEIVRRGCERIMMSHPKSSRDIQAIQALLLSNLSRGGGEGREMETYERYRSFCCTVLRRVMGFNSLTMPVPPTSPDGTEHACWRAWIRWEQLKRTALACFSKSAHCACRLFRSFQFMRPTPRCCTSSGLPSVYVNWNCTCLAQRTYGKPEMPPNGFGSTLLRRPLRAFHYERLWARWANRSRRQWTRA